MGVKTEFSLVNCLTFKTVDPPVKPEDDVEGKPESDVSERPENDGRGCVSYLGFP